MTPHRELCKGCGTCSDCVEEPRGSRMPPHLAPIDPHFYDAAFRPFTPAEKEMVEEKELVERARRAGL